MSKGSSKGRVEVPLACPPLSREEESKLAPLAQSKAYALTAIELLLKSLNYDYGDVEQIKVLVKIGSGGQAIYKNYLIRKPDRAGLDVKFFLSEFFKKHRDSELALPFKKDDPISWLVFVKDKAGKFHMADLSGHDADVKYQVFEEYAKRTLNIRSMVYTKQLDEHGDFIVN